MIQRKGGEWPYKIFPDQSQRKYGTGLGSNLMTPGSAFRLASVARHVTDCTNGNSESNQICLVTYLHKWVSRSITVFCFFGSPLHGPMWVCIFWLCCLFLNCWVELNQICEQLKQIVYTRAYFWVPHSEAPYNGIKSVSPFFFYANPNMLGWIQPNLLKGRLSFLTSGSAKEHLFFYPSSQMTLQVTS